jgi:hypothetical protein
MFGQGARTVVFLGDFGTDGMGHCSYVVFALNQGYTASLVKNRIVRKPLGPALTDRLTVQSLGQLFDLVPSNATLGCIFKIKTNELGVLNCALDILCLNFIFCRLWNDWNCQRNTERHGIHERHAFNDGWLQLQ